MKLTSTLFAVFVFGSCAFAQLPELIPFRKDGKFGFSDSLKNIVVEPEYEKVYRFYDGLARVRKASQFGFIDNTGKIIIPIKYNYAEDFCLGKTKVGASKREAKGIDTKGKSIELSKHFDLVRRNRDQFHVEVLSISNGLSQYGLMAKNGEILLDYTYKKITKTENGYWKAYTWEGEFTFLNPLGKQLFPPRKGKFGNDFHEGLCSFGSADGQQRGYMDTLGKPVFYLDNVLKYNLEFAEYGMFDPIDKQGLHFSEGKMGLGHEGLFGFIDKTGKVLIPYKYDRVWNFKDGFAKVKLNGKYGFVNHEGVEVVEIKYDVVNHFYEGLAFVKIAEKCGYVDAAGSEVIPLQFDHWQFEQFYNFENGKALIKNQEFYGLIDKTGKVLIEPKYDYIEQVSEDRAIVKLNAKSGLVDYSGNMYIPLEYRYVGEISKDTYRIIKEDVEGLYSKDGKEIFPIKFSRIELGLFGPELFTGAVPGHYSGRYYIDKYGTEYRE